MGIFRVPRKKISSQPPRTTSDIIRGKEQEIRLKQRDIKVTLSYRDVERALAKKRAYLIGALALLVLLFGMNRLTRTYASIAELSPISCLGGWENPANAKGKPDAESAETESFNAGNSAVLKSGSASELYCGSFAGDIPEETVPKNLSLKFSWVFKEPTQEPIVEISTSTPVEVPTSTPAETPEPETEPAAEPEPTPTSIPEAPSAPEPETEPAAWNFVARTFAAETQEQATEETPAQEIATEVIVPSPENLLEISYTLDGTTWNSLGQINKDNWANAEFVIPNDTIKDWSAVQNIQIGIRSLSSTGDAPTIYLDAMTLSVEYEEIPEEITPTSTEVDPVATSTIEITTSTEDIPLTGLKYLRVPEGTLVRSPITVSFRFEDWVKDMDFVDIFGEHQNYWWVQVDAADKSLTSSCYASSTIETTATFHLPPGDYYGITINSASNLENCEKKYGGQTPFEKPSFGEPGDGGNTRIFTVEQ
jgi:hypothetical protein